MAYGNLKLRRLVKWGLGALLVFFAGLMLRLTLPYLSFATDVDFLLTKQDVLHIRPWYWSFYIHITSSFIVMAAGITQFSHYFFARFRALHRLLGKLYVVAILLLGAPSGLVMAIYANGDFPAQVSFVLTATLWWWFTWQAYSSIRAGKVALHRAYMLRSYALTLSAITLRCYTMLLPMFFQVSGKDLYITVAWLSWVLNLLAAEYLIQSRFAHLDGHSHRAA